MKLLIMVSALLTNSLASAVSLTAQDAVNSMLKNGKDSKLIQLRIAQQWEPVFKARSTFDIRLKSEIAHEIDQSEQLFGSPFLESKRYFLKSSAAKKFYLGTDIELSYLKMQQETIKSAYSAGPIPPRQFQDIVQLQVKQPLWNNFFGYGDRAMVDHTYLNFKAEELQDKKDLELLIIKVLENYWKASVSKNRLTGLFSGKERYENLIKTITTKRKVGYARLAELEQAQAELEKTTQLIKIESLEYLSQLDELFRIMGQRLDGEIEFENPETLKEPSFAENKDLNSLKIVSIASLKVEATEKLKKQAESNSKPELNAVLSATSTGQDPNTQQSTNEMWGFERPTYYAGLQLSMAFGSGYTQQLRGAANARLQEAQIKKEQALEKVTNENTQFKRKLIALYAIYTSSVATVGYREASYKIIEKGFLQGDIDIADLISNYNSLTEAQLNQIKSKGDYIITLNEYAAFRDELIESYLKGTTE